MKHVIQNGGVQTVIATEDDKLITGTVQDCTPYVERAQAMHKAGAHGSGDMRHAAKLPYVVVEKYCNDNGITFQEWMNDKSHVRRMLNDPDNKMFRIWPGAV